MSAFHAGDVGSSNLDEYIGIKEAAEFFRCSVKHIRHKLAEHHLEGIRDGKFWKFQVADLMRIVWGPEKIPPGAAAPENDGTRGQTCDPRDEVARRAGVPPASSVGKTREAGGAATWGDHADPQVSSQRPPIPASEPHEVSGADIPGCPPIGRSYLQSLSPRERLLDIAAQHQFRELLGINATLQDGTRKAAREPERRRFFLKHKPGAGQPAAPMGRPKAAIDPAEVARLREEGLSMVEIAAKLGVSNATICRITKVPVQKHPASPPQPPTTPAPSTSCEDEKKSLQNSEPDSDLNRLNIVEGKTCPPDVPERFDPRDAAVRLQRSFRRLARIIAPRDPWMREDLVQEMSLAVLTCTEPGTRALFLDVAIKQGIDYFRYESMRGMASLDDITERPVEASAHPETLLVKWLLKERAATPAQIEEILGVTIVFEEPVRPRAMKRAHYPPLHQRLKPSAIG